MSEISDKIKNFTDLQLIDLIKKNSDNAFKELSERYKYEISFCVSKIFNIGFELDDLFQEARLGLLSAAKSYNAKIGISFNLYAKVCIKRKVYNFCKFYSRQKNLPLNNFLAINENICSEGEIFNNPESIFIKQEEILNIKEKIKSCLTALEFNVLSLYSHGYSYEDISKKLNINNKAVDNALQRAKKKIKI